MLGPVISLKSGNLIRESLLDGSWARLALLSTSPFGYLLAIVSDLS